MNSNKEQLKENYNKLTSKRKISNSKGVVWKSNRRNRAV